MAELAVFMEGDLVGLLESGAGNAVRFAYDPAWIERSDATPLSVSMPLRPGWFDDATVGPYLWGLLPDNEVVLQRWARQYQCSASNVFALLSNVGADVAGAAQYLPSGTAPDEARKGTHEKLSTADVAELLRTVRKDASAWHASDAAGRWSLAGAQSKIALAHDARRGWSIPRGQAPTTHILKPAIEDLADHDLNELLCVRAAALLGLRTEEIALGHFDDQRALVVTRYDRRTVGGRIERIHQEDFCQALRVPPGSKYQSDGGPSVEDMVGVLADLGTAPTDVERLCDAVAYNWLILGSDAHAKNYSLLLAAQQVRLAPLYDLGSLAPYAKHAPKVNLAQKVGGEYRAGVIAQRHLRRLAESARISPDDFVDRVDVMAQALPDALIEVAAEIELTGEERGAADRIIDAVSQWAGSRRGTLRPPRSRPGADGIGRPPTKPRQRQPKGTPRGGQFQPTSHDEASDVGLAEE